MYAEVRTGRHGVVGAVERTKQTHGGEDDRTHQHAQHNRPDPGLERQAEQHRETAEHGGGEGIGSAEDQAKQVPRAGGSLVVRNLFDSVGFDLRKAVVVIVMHDLLRS